MSIESVMPSNHLILCYPLLLPSIFPSIRVFSSESVPFASGGQGIVASASASVLPMNIQGWFLLGLTGLIAVKVNIAQSCLTLCDPVDYTVRGILQARILEWVAFPFSKGSSQPRSPTFHADSLPAEPPGKPKNTGEGSLSLLQGSSWLRNRTGVSCIAGEFFTNWATRDVPDCCGSIAIQDHPLPKRQFRGYVQDHLVNPFIAGQDST